MHSTLAILLYNLFITYFFIQKNTRYAIGSYFASFFITLFISLQMSYIFIQLASVTLPLAFIGLLVMQAYMIADISLFSYRKIRMQFSFLSFLKSPHSFYHSAKAIHSKEPLYFSLGTIAYDLCMGFFIEKTPQYMFSATTWIAAFLLTGIWGTLSFFTMEKSARYFLSSVFFLDEAYYCKKLLRICRKKHQKEIPFTPKGEKFHFISHQYPLLRYTEGFHTEKAFSIDTASCEKPHVIFLFMESFRAENIGTIGDGIKASPRFDEYAQQGILFKNFYSNGVLTHKSFFSSLFGIFPPFTISNLTKYDDYPLIGLPQIMKNYKYKTAMLHNGHLTFENQFSFFKNHGFDEVLGKKAIEKIFPKALATSWGIHDEYLMHYAIDWLEKQQTSPVFLNLFTISNHHPWYKPKDFTSPSFDVAPPYCRYLETFYYSDHALGIFLDEMKKRGFFDKSLIFIIADHGQPMGEHNNNFSNQRYLYEENIKIPLLILGNQVSPMVIEDIGSQVDLMPTVMDLLHLEGFHHGVGRSLARKGEKSAFFNNPYEQGYLGIRKGSEKYIWNHSVKEHALYDLAQDRKEWKNISIQESKKTKAYHKQALNFFHFFHDLYKNKRFTPKMSDSAKIVSHDANDEKMLSFLKKNKNPFSIDLSNSFITDKTLIHIAKTAPNICILNLNGCLHITDKGVGFLAKKCKNLMSLSLNHSSALSNKSIQLIMRHCILLEELSLEGLHHLTDAAFKERNSSIIRLNLLGCKISDQALDSLECSPYLEHLQLSCHHITDTGLEILGTKFKNLKKIILWNGEKITKKGINAIYQTNPLLKTFSIDQDEKCP